MLASVCISSLKIPFRWLAPTVTKTPRPCVSQPRISTRITPKTIMEIKSHAWCMNYPRQVLNKRKNLNGTISTKDDFYDTISRPNPKASPAYIQRTPRPICPLAQPSQAAWSCYILSVRSMCDRGGVQAAGGLRRAHSGAAWWALGHVVECEVAAHGPSRRTATSVPTSHARTARPAANKSPFVSR